MTDDEEGTCETCGMSISKRRTLCVDCRDVNIVLQAEALMQQERENHERERFEGMGGIGAG